jgi:hypothetical protein
MTGTSGFYSVPQQQTLVAVSCISGSLSVIGSSIILFIIGRDWREKLSHVYHRIILGMSIIDVITSFNFIFSFLLLPEGEFWGARGNTLTCEISGFLVVMATSAGLYTFGLAIYFCLVTQSYREKNYITIYIEPFIHLIAIFAPVGISIWALLENAFKPVLGAGGWCWMHEYPVMCFQLEDVECTRGQNWKRIGIFSVFGLMTPAWFGIIICLCLGIGFEYRKQHRNPTARIHCTRDQGRYSFSQHCTLVHSLLPTSSGW